MSGSSGGEGPQGMLSDMKGQFNLFTAICAYLAAPLAAVAAKPGTIGERFQGFILMVGVGLQFLVVLFAGGPTGGAEALLAFGLMCIVLLSHRLYRGRRRRAGYRCHSLYTGVPILRGNELGIKGVTIPLLALLAGLSVVEFLPGIGTWLVVAAAAQAVTVSVYRQQLAAQVRALEDARIEQEIIRQHYQEQS